MKKRMTMENEDGDGADDNDDDGDDDEDGDGGVYDAHDADGSARSVRYPSLRRREVVPWRKS